MEVRFRHLWATSWCPFGIHGLTNFTLTVTFEPTVDMAALSSFLVVAVMFLSLQAKVSAVNEAAKRRKRARVKLRDLKRRELSSGDEGIASEARRAVEGYKQALEDEEATRTIVPGVRIVAPFPSADEEDISAAKQFLGIDLASTGAGPRSDESESEPLSSGAVAILATIAVAQLGLLILFATERGNF